MVDPISVIAISGLSSIGGWIIGKITKKTPDNKELNIPPNEIKFIAVKDVIDPDEIFKYVNNINPVFVNVKELDKTKLMDFLELLAEEGNKSNYNIKHVASDLLMVGTSEQKINVQILNNKLDELKPIDIAAE